MERIHQPVLIEELRDLLNLKTGDNVIDATLDGGGHAEMLLHEVGPSGKVLGIDQDLEMIKKMNGVRNLIPVLGNFRTIDQIANKNNFKDVEVILFDLGVSTWHIKESGRGFSFEKPEEPVLMRLNLHLENSAANILNTYPETELARIFEEFGEVRGPREIARKIISARKKKRIYSVGNLLGALGIKNKKSLARIFQALRIGVNDELAALEEGLIKGFNLLLPGGRMAVISYHSLEDRIVKNFCKKQPAVILTQKPVTASREEILKNPSARSAKLRILKKT